MDTPVTDLAALEQFVVQNEALSELEARIGRFNIFDALGVVNKELQHSNFLAWLLDPGESHGLGGLFLNAFLMDLLRKTDSKKRLFSPIRLDGGELRGVEVRREWKNIDLLITCDDPSFVIAIENKVYSGEGPDQLSRYEKIVKTSDELARHENRQLVFLTRDGEPPSKKTWTIYSYADLYRALKRVRETNAEQIGDEVRSFLDHYLRLIGNHFMDNEEITELCREIYKNHRQAIELIVAHGRSVAPGLNDAADGIAGLDGWLIRHQARRQIYFAPSAWDGSPMATRTEPSGKTNNWVELMIEWTNNYCYFTAFVGPSDDPDLRRFVIEHLRREGSKFGFKTKGKITPDWTRIRSQHKLKVFNDNMPDPDVVASKVIDFVKRDLAGYDRLAQVIANILKKWDRK